MDPLSVRGGRTPTNGSNMASRKKTKKSTQHQKEKKKKRPVDATVKRGFPRDKIKPALLSATFRDIGGFSTKRGTEGA